MLWALENVCNSINIPRKQNTVEVSALAGETDLQKLLSTMSPEFLPDTFVFCTVQGIYGDYSELSPLASFSEPEGLTLVITEEKAKRAGLSYETTFKAITLTVHSSLDAVGLTAAVSSQLAEKGISANIIAAYYHDHIFVQAEKAELAMETLINYSYTNEI